MSNTAAAIDDIIVFHRLLQLGKPSKVSTITDGLGHWHYQIGMVLMGTKLVKDCLRRLGDAGLVERPTTQTYVATWGKDETGVARPPLPLSAPALRDVPSTGPFCPARREMHAEGWLYPVAGRMDITHTGALGGATLIRDGGGCRMRTSYLASMLADIHRKSGYQVYRSAENTLQMRAKRMGFAVDLREGRMPRCPVCSDELPGFGEQTCRICDRKMIFRQADGPFCTGTVTTGPVDITLMDPTGQAPGSLWTVGAQLQALHKMLLEAK